MLQKINSMIHKISSMPNSFLKISGDTTFPLKLTILVLEDVQSYGGMRIASSNLILIILAL